MSTKGDFGGVETHPVIFKTQHAKDPTQLYGYIPTLWICILFIALFSITTIIHLIQALHYRMYWLIPTACLAGLGEVIGWSGRLWSSENSLLLNPYLMQITTTIIAPTPFIASDFVILGSIIFVLGTQYSRLSPIWYTIVFCSCDIIALVIQAVGGAIASINVQNNKNPDKPGGHIMLGGIAFQLAALIIYSLLGAEFFLRYHFDKPVRKPSKPKVKNGVVISMISGRKLPELTVDRRLKVMVGGLMFSTVCLLIRSIYRTLELQNGFSGTIIHTQVLFNVLDGAMITLAMFSLNFIHPGMFLNPSLQKANAIRIPSSPSNANNQLQSETIPSEKLGPHDDHEHEQDGRGSSTNGSITPTRLDHEGVGVGGGLKDVV